MAAPRKLPDETVLERWYLREKLTYREMAERWANTPGGHTCTPAAFGAACTGADWFVPRNMKHAGTDHFPWTNVRAEHTDMHDAQMLRLYGRREAGEKLAHRLERDLKSWLRTLYDENAVIAYKPNTNQGWWHVKKERQDVGIVRWPAEYRRRAERRLTVVPEAG